MKKDDSDKEILNQFYLIFTMFNWNYRAFSSNFGEVNGNYCIFIRNFKIMCYFYFLLIFSKKRLGFLPRN